MIAEPPVGVALGEGVVPEPESDAFEQRQNALGDDRREVPFLDRVDDVERDADRDGLAVAEPMMRHRLELVRRPVAEIERPRAAQLERIAAAADVREVQLGGAPDQRCQDRQVAAAMFATCASR